MKPFKIYKIWNKAFKMYHSFDKGKYTLFTSKEQARGETKKLQQTYKEKDNIEIHEYFAIPNHDLHKISNRLADIFNNRWAYMPPRKGEVHCLYCEKRSWWGDKEEHEEYCQILSLKEIFDYIQKTILENM